MGKSKGGGSKALRDDPSRPQGSVATAGLGAEVEVYWPDDDAWYTGILDSVDKSKKKGYHITYEDGEEEWVDLKQERWALKAPGKGVDGAPEPESSKKAPAASKSKSGKADKGGAKEGEEAKAAEKKKAPETKAVLEAAEPPGAGKEPKPTKSKGKAKAPKKEEAAPQKDEATPMDVDEAPAKEADVPPTKAAEGKGKEKAAKDKAKGPGVAGAVEDAAEPPEKKDEKAGARKRKTQEENSDADAGPRKTRGDGVKKVTVSSPGNKKAGGKEKAQKGDKGDNGQLAAAAAPPSSPKARKVELPGAFAPPGEWEAQRGMKLGKPLAGNLLADEPMYKVYESDDKGEYEVFCLVHHMSANEINVRCWSSGRIVVIRSAQNGGKEKPLPNSKVFDIQLPGKVVPESARAMLCSHGQLHTRVRKAPGTS
eukprot:jgi/Botrbrau1/22748/Bobra.0132s0081.1